MRTRCHSASQNHLERQTEAHWRHSSALMGLATFQRLWADLQAHPARDRNNSHMSLSSNHIREFVLIP